ncbi:hypothetical protein ACFQ0G_39885 [Streptomyces chiangmaiensis]
MPCCPGEAGGCPRVRGRRSAAWSAGRTGLPVTLGPRDDWFAADAVRTFLTRAYRVSSAGNRGSAHRGSPAGARPAGALPSEGTVLGAVQVPPRRQSGRLPGRPSGDRGYPMIAVVRPASRPPPRRLWAPPCFSRP